MTLCAALGFVRSKPVLGRLSVLFGPRKPLVEFAKAPSSGNRRAPVMKIDQPDRGTELFHFPYLLRVLGLLVDNLRVLIYAN